MLIAAIPATLLKGEETLPETPPLTAPACSAAFRTVEDQGTGSAMIDWQIANDLKQAIGAEVFDQVVTVFFMEADSTMTRLMAATSAEQMKNELHFMKGSALNLGFNELAELCQSLESRAEAGDADLPLAKVQTVYASSRVEFFLRRDQMIP